MQNLLLMKGNFIDTTIFLKLIYNKIEFTVLHFNYDQNTNRAEVECITNLCKKYNVEFIDKYYLDKELKEFLLKVSNGYKNSAKYQYILSLAAIYADNVYIGLNEQENCNYYFLAILQILLDKSFDKTKNVIAPLLNLNLQQCILLGIWLDKDLMSYVSMCETPNYNSLKMSPTHQKYGCGSCQSCIDRFKGVYNVEGQELSKEKLEFLLKM